MANKQHYDSSFYKELIAQINRLESKKAAVRRTEGRGSKVPPHNSPIAQKAAAYLLKKRKKNLMKGRNKHD